MEIKSLSLGPWRAAPIAVKYILVVGRSVHPHLHGTELGKVPLDCKGSYKSHCCTGVVSASTYENSSVVCVNRI